MAGIGRVEHLIFQSRQKPVDRAFAKIGQVLLQRHARKLAVAIVIVFGPGGANNCQLGRDQLIVVQRAQRR